MIIKILTDVRSRYDGYKSLTGSFDIACKLKSEIVILDFEAVQFFDANLCAILGAYIEIFKNNDNRVQISNLKNSIRTVFRKNAFLNEFDEEILDDIHSTSIKYRKFIPSDDHAFKNYVKTELLGKNDFPSHSLLLGQKIIENIFELYENARTHGQCDFIHTCGQYFPQHESKPLRFTIVDTGVNIKENVSAYLVKDIKSTDAIQWAIQKGNTTKSGSIPGGLGLDIIFQFIKLNNGKIQIVSSDGFWEYKNGYINTQMLDFSFRGTIANLEFNLNDNNHYHLSDEKYDMDVDNLF